VRETGAQLRIWGVSVCSVVVNELEALITQHLRIATAILYVALAGELAAVGLL
jgi:hypothetical protein